MYPSASQEPSTTSKVFPGFGQFQAGYVSFSIWVHPKKAMFLQPIGGHTGKTLTMKVAQVQHLIGFTTMCTTDDQPVFTGSTSQTKESLSNQRSHHGELFRINHCIVMIVPALSTKRFVVKLCKVGRRMQCTIQILSFDLMSFGDGPDSHSCSVARLS